MTHYSVGIIVPPTIRRIEWYVHRQMSRYDLHRKVSGYSVNPDGRWDWYEIGGRWEGWLFDKQLFDVDDVSPIKRPSIENNMVTTEAALARNKIPNAIITPDRRWLDGGERWIFGLAPKPRRGWNAAVRYFLAKHPGHRFVIVDAHA